MTSALFASNSNLINTPAISQLNISVEKLHELQLYPADMPFSRLFDVNSLELPDLVCADEQNAATTMLPHINRHLRRAAKALGLTEDELREQMQKSERNEPVAAENPVDTSVPIARDRDLLVAEIMLQFKTLLTQLFERAESSTSQREMEAKTVDTIFKLGRSMLTQVFALMAAHASEEKIKKLRLPAGCIYLRFDKDYHVVVTTTLGEITVPLFAFRVKNDGKSKTHVPARNQLFPFHGHCRSSALCLEWEARLGSQQTFRESEQSLAFFSHDAIKQADNTIAVHVVKVGSVINRDYLYRSPAEIREILAEKATRDKHTAQPIVYFSTDAHALRRFIDETWHGAWKMANGLRIWCVDQKTNQIIHLGGEYTWGDCEAVEETFKSLTQSGHLPADGDYGDGIRAQYVIVTDGATWIENRIVPIFPHSCAILDAYHALETVSKYLKEMFGSETPEANAFYRRAVEFLLGKSEKSARTTKTRKGHKKIRKLTKQNQTTEPINSTEPFIHREQSSGTIPHQIQELIDTVMAVTIDEKRENSQQRLVQFLRENAHRIDYISYRTAGYQIGSGAMESLHRTGSQMRLKLPGAKWLAETAQAIFNIRMMTIVGKWKAFWGQSEIMNKLTNAFGVKPQMAPA